MDLRFGVDYDDEDQAKDVEGLLKIFLPIIAQGADRGARLPGPAGD